MGNAFDRTQAQIDRRRASRAAALNPPDPSKVTRLNPSRYKQTRSSDRYEQGVIDGLNGKAAGRLEENDPKLFGAYLDGLKAGDRARLARSRREAKARRRWEVPVRPIPSEAEVAQELSRREAKDREVVARRRRTGILRELAY